MRALQQRRFFYFFLLILFPGYVQAGAWTQPQGHGQIILNGYYYTADKRFDNSGNTVALPQYNKYELNPYVEYGYTDFLTLGANLSLQAVSQESGSGTLTNYGLGDSEFFARVRLWQKGGMVVSAMPLVKLPSPERASEQPKIGATHPDAALGIAGGYGFELFGQHHFADVAAMYRYRFGTPENQINFSTTLGIGITPRWTVLPQVFVTQRAETPTAATFTQSSGDDYDATKLQLSAAYAYSPTTTFQAGVFGDVDGKNTGIGRGVLLSVWRNF